MNVKKTKQKKKVGKMEWEVLHCGVYVIVVVVVLVLVLVSGYISLEDNNVYNNEQYNIRNTITTTYP